MFVINNLYDEIDFNHISLQQEHHLIFKSETTLDE